jgi:hypothetical protein
MLLAIQRDIRRRTVAKQMKEMKKAFNKEWKDKVIVQSFLRFDSQ